MQYEVIEDRHVIGQWRAEAIDHDSEGECYVVIFSGPNAKERAQHYVAMMSDPERTADRFHALIEACRGIDSFFNGEDGSVGFPEGFEKFADFEPVDMTLNAGIIRAIRKAIRGPTP